MESDKRLNTVLRTEAQLLIQNGAQPFTTPGATGWQPAGWMQRNCLTEINTAV